ncbi:MAG: hypothetical protein K2G55_01760 [Lachnospiraceae bacterium]|nr:hypothetical protein [Lachnospiraceae bacterium]MDE7204379.1 hypothetical protein [Lachnospiraceae bacterium]
MDNEIFEMVTQSLTEGRISRIMNCDEEYEAAKLHERVVHDKLMELLTDQQKELFDDYITAASETDANAERIVYQQGMKDLYALLMALA